MDLQTSDADGIRKGMEKMERAFEIYPYCTVALNYLANHFFFTGQHFLVEQLTETALASGNHRLMKSHSYYNLARSYHSKGDFDKAGRYYMASVNEISKPQEFILPYYGLTQVQLKLGDFRSSLLNPEKVLEFYPENCESLKAFLELGELLLNPDAVGALDSLKTASNLLRKQGEQLPIELINNVGVLHFERGDFELASKAFKEALGDGIWISLIEGRFNSICVDSNTSITQYRSMNLFRQLGEDGDSLEVPWEKVTTLFNYARLLEQLHDTERAIVLYRLILFKFLLAF